MNSLYNIHHPLTLISYEKTFRIQKKTSLQPLWFTVEREYTRFRLGEGRNLTGFKGSGILDASEAAVKAFATCR